MWGNRDKSGRLRNRITNINVIYQPIRECKELPVSALIRALESVSCSVHRLKRAIKTFRRRSLGSLHVNFLFSYTRTSQTGRLWSGTEVTQFYRTILPCQTQTSPGPLQLDLSGELSAEAVCKTFFIFRYTNKLGPRTKGGVSSNLLFQRSRRQILNKFLNVKRWDGRLPLTWKLKVWAETPTSPPLTLTEAWPLFSPPLLDVSHTILQDQEMKRFKHLERKREKKTRFAFTFILTDVQ